MRHRGLDKHFFEYFRTIAQNQCLLLLVIPSYLLHFNANHFRTIKMDPKIITLPTL